MCRDFAQKQSCPRGAHCTFAHSKAELDKYRCKNRPSNGLILPIASSNLNVATPSSYSAPAAPLPIFTSTNGNHLLRPIAPTILPLWNPQQQQTQHFIQEVPQQHHHQ